MNFIINVLTPPIFIIAYSITFYYFFFKIFKNKPNLEEYLISFIFINAFIFILLFFKIKVYILIQIFFLITFLFSIYILYLGKTNLLNFKSFKFLIFKNKYYNYLFYLFFFTYLVISLYPINDADSYAYHLAWPKYVIESPKTLFNMSFLEFRVIGIGEIVNYISLSIYSENLQSFLSLILFTILLIKFLKDKPVLFFLCFSSPLLIKYIFCQKPFFIPSLIFALSAYVIFDSLRTSKLSKLKIIFILSSISYVAMTKYTFIPICFVLLVYFYYNFIKSNLGDILKYSILCFAIVCFPLLFAKFIYFQDPFSPFLEKIFNNNPDIVAMSEMYKDWEGFSSGGSFKLVNFAIPQSPFTWIDTFGLIILFPFFYFIRKKSWTLIIMILIMTTVISYVSNFQARWYIPIFLTMIFLSEKCKFERKKYFFIPLNLYSTALFCFFFIYLSFTIYTHSTYGIEGLKSKRIYLYSFLNSEKDLKTGYTLTNARNIFFSNKFIGYRYPAYSKSILRKNYKNDIKNGIFFGINNLSDFKKKISISLDCVSSYNFQDIPVAKRNFFGTKEFEKVLKVKFKNNLIQCL